MSFASFRKECEEQSKALPRVVVARGKRSFFMRSMVIGGIGFWLAMNALFIMRDGAGLTGRFLAGWEVTCFLLSILVSLVISRRMWNRIKQLAKSE
jgi:hypothetical protein